ncbi:putative phage abortive infection protein [Gilvimarinus polysaccharolyticus]|uniref:putative phage abortive infection protein n=1 Tax=Gilvimarinus polysaccharolyticus TaxID=863921 RepID=UPI000673346A|nr:putative phage abortive infection protein [Gilvimarinus polysaccharolyticus]
MRLFFWGIAVVVALVFILFSVAIVYLTWPISTNTVEKAAHFGDSFGVVTSLFTAFGFLGVLATINLQREQFYKAEKISQRQNNENSFFGILDLYKKNLDAVKISNSDGLAMEGVGAFKYILDILNEKLTRHNKYKEDERYIQLYYVGLLSEISAIVHYQSRYLETFKNVLIQIASVKESDEERERYICLFVSQLTSYEIKYLFYICLIEDCSSDLVGLVHEFRVFERCSSLLPRGKHKQYLYEVIHGKKFPAPKRKKARVFDQEEIRRLRRNYKKTMQQPTLK